MVFALQEAQMRYHNVGLPYRLSIISLSFPHSCATGGFPLANGTCMCRHTLPRRWHRIIGRAAQRGAQKQGPPAGGEGEGGAGEDVRGYGGVLVGVNPSVQTRTKNEKVTIWKGMEASGVCVRMGTGTMEKGGWSDLSRSQHTLFEYGHHLRFRSASLDSATSSQLCLSVSISSIFSCCSFSSLISTPFCFTPSSTLLLLPPSTLPIALINSHLLFHNSRFTSSSSPLSPTQPSLAFAYLLSRRTPVPSSYPSPTSSNTPSFTIELSYLSISIFTKASVLQIFIRSSSHIHLQPTAILASYARKLPIHDESSLISV